MSWLNLTIFMLSLLGFVGLALAMPKHSEAVFKQTLTNKQHITLRVFGWLFLFMALALGIAELNFDLGTVVWVGWLSIAGLLLAFYLPFGPWQADKGQKSTKIPLAKVTHEGKVQSRKSIIISTAVVIIPLLIFVFQLLNTPIKPLLRDGAVSGEIGPWTFVIAEKEQEAPIIEAMDIPLKAFVIRFCERCDADIRMAYLKMRQPRSLRALGNSFNGRGETKTAIISIPAAATIDDGLWLSVEAKNGEVYHQQFNVEQLSPALVSFIKEGL